MSVYDIGQFRVQQLNIGYKVSWEDKGQRHYIDIDLPWLIEHHIQSHLIKIAHLIELMDKSPDALLDDPIGFAIINSMPDSDLIPGRDLPSYLIEEFHRQQIVKGYNKHFNTQFTLSMVQEYL